MPNDLELLQSNSIEQELQELGLHALSAVNTRTSGSTVCGKSNKQPLKKTTVDYLLRTAEPGETIRGRHTKIIFFQASLLSGVVNFIQREGHRLPPVMASYTTLRMETLAEKTKGIFCYYSNTRSKVYTWKQIFSHSNYFFFKLMHLDEHMVFHDAMIFVH